MRQVPIRELNLRTAHVLARVERGERVEITRNGVAIAVIEPARPHPLQSLLERGEVRAATGRLPLEEWTDPPARDEQGLDAILDDRYGGEHGCRLSRPADALRSHAGRIRTDPAVSSPAHAAADIPRHASWSRARERP